MGKNVKACLILIFLFIALISCSGISFVGGISFSQLEREDEKIIEKKEYSEKPIYYSKESSDRYVDKETAKEIFELLLSQSDEHFSFDFEVEDEKTFAEDRDFILVNLENQYSRLSTKFDIDINVKIKVKLVDDLDIFQSDLNSFFEVETIVPYSAFAYGDDLIEIYINPMFTTDKFEVARTLSHELVHIFQYQYNNNISLYHPKWLIEGVAEYFSYPNEEVLIHNEIFEKIDGLSGLENLVDSVDPENYTVGYNCSELFIEYLISKNSESKIVSLFGQTYNFDSFFSEKLGVAPEVAFDHWIKSI